MKAVIVGGGIAGPATALALRHVGVDAVVLEAWPRSDGEVGSWLTLAPNGLHALACLDALGVAQSIGFPTDDNVMYGATGRLLGRVSLGVPLPDGSRGLTLKRSRLALALAEEAERRGVQIRWGSRVTEITDEGERVVVTLHGGEKLSADVLIGADGVHSLVRRALDPAAAAARYVGLTNFGGITRGAAQSAGLEPRAWHFVFGTRAFFGAQPTPAGDVVWFVNVPREPITAAERDSTSLGQWQTWLADLLAADAGSAADLVRAGELELVADNTHDLGHVPVWHRGRAVLLGDAAHAPSPSSGQGASMALEDAVVLAACLRDARSVDDALRSFVGARRHRVERIVKVGARSSSAKIPGRVGRSIRDAGMRFAFEHLVTERSLAWMTGHRVSLEPMVGSTSAT